MRVPRSQRVCRCCSFGTVEDEMHIMMECTMYEDIRSEYMQIRGINLQSASMNMMVDCELGDNGLHSLLILELVLNCGQTIWAVWRWNSELLSNIVFVS